MAPAKQIFQATIEQLVPNRVARYQITRSDKHLSYARVLDLWQGTDDAFRTYFAQLLAHSPFAAYRWETPPITQATVSREFEFVLINTPEFDSRRTDASAFASYFTNANTDQGVVVFPNLGRDATMVVPSPRTDTDAYGHLASFIQLAPSSQVDAFWRVAGRAAEAHLGDAPIWISTAGGGVAWLHLRLDSRPKYYGFDPYRGFP